MEEMGYPPVAGPDQEDDGESESPYKDHEVSEEAI
jgi:hypothetical protein